MRSTISTIQEVADSVLRFTDDQPPNPHHFEVVAEEYVPPPRRLLKFHTFDPKSLQGGLMSRYMWRMGDTHDARRISIFGRGADKLTATALWVWASPFPSAGFTEDMKCHPSVLADGAGIPAAAPPGAPEAPPDPAADEKVRAAVTENLKMNGKFIIAATSLSSRRRTP